ncbi:MAG: hypothetical protein EXQ94_04735 [Alphaproteobacteria bacterium]|nr:hypothetical protein [Alphaproteobacteria bacterium]
MSAQALRYSWRTLGPDYARAGAGFALTGGPLILVPAAPVVVAVLAAMAALFILFAARTAIRHGTRLILSETALRTEGPFARSLPWASLRGMKLAYYATRRDRKGGWMQLRLRGYHGSLTVDSGIDRFPDIVRMAYGAARCNGLRLGGATIANVAAMGLARDDDNEGPNP